MARGVAVLVLTLLSVLKAFGQAQIGPSEQAALQAGARTFVNYCMGCHSLQYQRYERVAKDLGIPEDLLKGRLILAGEVGDAMRAAMDPRDAKRWFGVVPPDLTLVARVRGEQWLHDYLQGFYEDPSRPWGVDNIMFPGVAMPNVLAPLQGRQVLICSERKEGAGKELKSQSCNQLKHLPATGSLSEQQFGETVDNLVSFLAYSANPNKYQARQIGVYVLLYLSVLFVLVYLLKREYWKNV
ncbi:ubiquinol-cytochrome c reductase cytochrome c1 subunit [Pseudomonas duriflava]|uniref:Ubiquinol-cytochrome c reductase cytochrome c1 subunit n=1 Tax=Pseudomonas duriflava TaxID=459528 RepID=A0A562QFA8_9PSED|nr:cytochrome c1 [Pseudomonas duriflava]TWI55421.1 ubiquinol-cytochrome c reductase cytochrome c1 subunit [Pseudomonas duriflava]